MNFRFVEFDEELRTYQLLGISHFDDFATAYKTFVFMKEHEEEMLISDYVDDFDASSYIVKDVAFIAAPIGSDTPPCVLILLK